MAPEFARCHTAEQPAGADLRLGLHPELDLDLWPGIAPEFARCHTADQPAGADFWLGLHPELDLGLWPGTAPEFARCHTAEHPAGADLIGWDFTLNLQGIMLPSNLRALTFSTFFNRSLQGVTLPSALQTLMSFCQDNLLTMSFGIFYTMFVKCQAAVQHADMHLSQQPQPQLARCHAAVQPTSLHLWPGLAPESASVTLTSSLQTLTFDYQFDQSS